MKKAKIIAICTIIAIATVVGVIMFIPHTENIHFERPFTKREITMLVPDEGSIPYGTEVTISMDVDITSNRAGIYSAKGTLKIGDRTVSISKITKGKSIYFFEENEDDNSVDINYSTKEPDRIAVIIYEGDQQGVWLPKEYVPVSDRNAA